MVLLILVVAWAIVLVPWWLRSRAERGSAGSVHESLRRLSALGGSQPARSGSIPLALQQSTATMARTKARQSRKRRHDVFMGLLASSVGSAGLGIFVPQLWMLHAVVDALLVAFVLLLLRLRHGTTAYRQPALRNETAAAAAAAAAARDYAYVYSQD